MVHILLAAFFALFVTAPARAATINVNTTTDELNTDGDCSLREAVKSANDDTAMDACTAGSGDDIINIPAGTYTLTLAGAGEDWALTGDLDIRSNITLVGAGSDSTILDGNASDRVVDVIFGPASISNLTIRNGRLTDSYGGGGIVNGAICTLENVKILSNVATGTADDIGGGLCNRGTLTMNNCTVDGNSADRGGGIFDNNALTVSNSTISNNNASFMGGGIVDFSQTETFTNVTISNNTATSDYGGMLARSNLNLTMINCTFKKNTGNGIDDLYVESNAAVTMKNTLLDKNSGNSCLVNGTLTSSGHNLENGNTCNFIHATDLINTDPLLRPLADNGGPTQTHEITLQSPALNGGDNTGCPATDQRGVSRPQGVSCDIGAYELELRPGSATNLLLLQ